jgi:hypothetical protein
MAWTAGVIGLIVVAQLGGSDLVQNLPPGSLPSAPVQSRPAGRFPAGAGRTGPVVVRTTAPVAVGPLPSQDSHQVSTDGHIAFAAVAFNQDAPDISTTGADRVIATAQSLARHGYRAAPGPQPISVVVGSGSGSGEGVGVAAAMILLLLAFTSYRPRTRYRPAWPRPT